MIGYQDAEVEEAKQFSCHMVRGSFPGSRSKLKSRASRVNWDARTLVMGYNQMTASRAWKTLLAQAAAKTKVKRTVRSHRIAAGLDLISHKVSEQGHRRPTKYQSGATDWKVKMDQLRRKGVKKLIYGCNPSFRHESSGPTWPSDSDHWSPNSFRGFLISPGIDRVRPR